MRATVAFAVAYAIVLLMVLASVPLNGLWAPVSLAIIGSVAFGPLGYWAAHASIGVIVAAAWIAYWMLSPELIDHDHRVAYSQDHPPPTGLALLAPLIALPALAGMYARRHSQRTR